MITSHNQRQGGKAVEYIRTHEVEKLFELWPYLEAIYQQIAGEKYKDTDRDACIYSLAIGNKPMDNMPPAGKISDPTSNIATTYFQVMVRELRFVARQQKNEILLIATVIDRLEYAFHRLSFLQQKILPLYYWDKLPWKEISQQVSLEGRYISQNAAQEMRRKGIEKMATDIEMPNYKYDRLMNILYDLAK